jgi:hypothetical protein
MGKKKKYRKEIESYFEKNPVLVALAAGAACGLVIAEAFGLAKEIVESVEDAPPSTFENNQKRLAT